MPLRMCLIHPPLPQEGGEIYYPINLAIVSAILKSGGHDTCAIDLNLSSIQDGGATAEHIELKAFDVIDGFARHCDLFGFSTFYITYPLVLRLARAIKLRYGKPIVLGGPHATLTGFKTMTIAPWIDFIVKHEAEITLPKLMHAIEHRKNYSDIKGILYRNNGRIIETPDRPLISNLDDSPFPDFDAIDYNAYKRKTDKLYATVDIGRGCPCHCTFCSAPAIWKHTCRMKSPKRVVSEMDAMHDTYNVDSFVFTHDNFTALRDYVLAFCKEVRTRDYAWDCFARCDMLDDEMVSAMKEAGCNGMYFGIESSSGRIQKAIRKNLDRADIDRAIKLCIDHNINYSTSYIIGFPEEDPADLEKTFKSYIRDASRNNSDTTLTVLGPLPGSETARCHSEGSDLFPMIDNNPALLMLEDEALEEAKESILRNPDIYLPFYRLATDNFTAHELIEIQVFFKCLATHFPHATHMILSLTSVSPLQIFSIYHESHSALSDDSLSRGEVHSWLSDIIHEKATELGKYLLLAEEILKYEYCIYRLRSAVNKVQQRESLLKDSELNDRSGTVSINCAFERISFEIDIHEALDNIRSESFEYVRRRKPGEYIIYFDSRNNDLVSYKLNEYAKVILDLATQHLSISEFVLKIDELCDSPEKALKVFADLQKEGLFKHDEDLP